MIDTSIVVPVYNERNNIQTLIQAINKQTYPKDKFELIICDNNSTDGTKKRIREIETEFSVDLQLVVESEIQSSYAARNKGIRAASGDVIALTDADCLPARTWLERGVEAVNTDAPYIGGRIDMTFQNNRPNVWEYLDAARKLDNEIYVQQDSFAATANCFVKQVVFDDCGLFLPELESSGDYEFGQRVAKEGINIEYAPEAVVNHPSRKSFGSIISKSKRIARGKRQLVEQGQTSGADISVRDLLPTMSLPGLESVTLSKKNQFLMFFGLNFIEYYIIMYKLYLKFHS